jgi:2-phosphosulfolactate phosphatase
VGIFYRGDSVSGHRLESRWVERSRFFSKNRMHWHCHNIFHRMPSAATAGGIAVVIDVLRASTTMITALAHGAVAVLPRRSIEEVRAAAGSTPGAILGGERQCVRIDGFDVGNSPLEYTADRVAGRTVIITTTNGTAALAACSQATEVLVGAMVNRTALAKAARRLAATNGCHAIHLVCAGTDGEITEEDILTAGAILDAAAYDVDASCDVLDADAVAARDQYRAVAHSEGLDNNPRIMEAFRASPGGRNLVALGMEADISAAAAVDSLAFVPRLDPRCNRLTPLPND